MTDTSRLPPIENQSHPQFEIFKNINQNIHVLRIGSPNLIQRFNIVHKPDENTTISPHFMVIIINLSGLEETIPDVLY